MINITSKTKKEYTISLLQSDIVHLFNNLERLITNNPNTILVFNIKARNVTISEVEYQKLKAYGVTINMFFKNREEVASIPLDLDTDGRGTAAVVEKGGEVGMEGDKKTIVFKKPIRSGQTEVFNVGTILTENISDTGRVISYNNLVLLKENHGTITIEGGSLLINPNRNYGKIVINGMDITEALMEDSEMKLADKVLIEKEEENIIYKIYQ